MRTLEKLKGITLFRSAGNAHRYFYFLNGKIHSFLTHEKDVLMNLAEMFGQLNAFFPNLQSTFVRRAVALGMLATLMTPTAVMALPQGGQSVAGGVTFSQPNANTLNVNTSAQRAIANYQSFNVSNGNTVNFNLPSSKAAILNRVIGQDPSRIFGNINSNGQVYLVNPSGILFGSSARVNVGSLFASTLDITNHDFLNGNMVFFKNPNYGPASVTNEGVINIQKDGFAVLSGASVSNTGTINAPQAQVHLAVGDKISMAVSNDILIDVTVDQALQQGVEGVQDAIANSGTIKADGGLVQMQAKLANQVYDRLVNNSGVVEALSVAEQDGIVSFVAQTEGGGGLVQNTGTVNVSGNDTAPNGGSISIEGDIVHQSGQLLAEGGEGGQGGNIYLHSTEQTVLSEDSVTSARGAAANSSGGEIIVLSDVHTDVKQGALLDVSAGSESGDGGFVEVSAQDTVDIYGTVKLGAPNGIAGTLLIDPVNFTLNNGNYNSTFKDIDGNLILWATQDLTVSLSGATSAHFANINESSETLTLRAGRHLNINSDLSTGGGNISLLADADMTGSVPAGSGTNETGSFGGNPSNGTGTLTVASGKTVSSSNGNILLHSAELDLLGSVNAGTGEVTVTTSTTKNIVLGGAASDSSTQLALSSGELGRITASSLNINSLQNVSLAGGVNVSAASGPGSYNLNFDLPGTFNANGHAIQLGSNDLTIDAGNTVTLGQITGNGAAADISVTANNNILAQGTLGGRNLTFTTLTGNKTITFNEAITAGGTFTALSTGDILAKKAVNAQNLLFDITGGNRDITFEGLLSSSGNVDITASRNLTFKGEVSSNTLDLTAGNNLLFEQSVTTTGDLTAQASGDLTAKKALSGFNIQLTTTGSNNNILLEDTVTATGDLTATANGDITTRAASAQNITFTATSSNKDITIGGNLSANEEVNLTANRNIRLDNGSALNHTAQTFNFTGDTLIIGNAGTVVEAGTAGGGGTQTFDDVTNPINPGDTITALGGSGTPGVINVDADLDNAGTLRAYGSGAGDIEITYSNSDLDLTNVTINAEAGGAGADGVINLLGSTINLGTIDEQSGGAGGGGNVFINTLNNFGVLGTGTSITAESLVFNVSNGVNLSGNFNETPISVLAAQSFNLTDTSNSLNLALLNVTEDASLTSTGDLLVNGLAQVGGDLFLTAQSAGSKIVFNDSAEADNVTLVADDLEVNAGTTVTARGESGSFAAPAGSIVIDTFSPDRPIVIGGPGGQLGVLEVDNSELPRLRAGQVTFGNDSVLTTDIQILNDLDLSVLGYGLHFKTTESILSNNFLFTLGGYTLDFTAGKDITLTTTGDNRALTFTSATAGGNILVATDGDNSGIDVSGKLDAIGNVTVQTEGHGSGITVLGGIDPVDVIVQTLGDNSGIVLGDVEATNLIRLTTAGNDSGISVGAVDGGAGGPITADIEITTAGNDSGISIGTAGTPKNVDGKTVLISTDGLNSIIDLSGDVTAVDGNVSLLSNLSDLNLGGNVSAAENGITLSARNITQAAGTLISGDTLALQGTLGGQFGTLANPLNTSVNSLTVSNTTGSGSAYVANNQALTLGASSVGGTLSVSADDDLNVNGALNGHNITLQTLANDGNIHFTSNVHAVHNLNIHADGAGNITQSAVGSQIRGGGAGASQFNLSSGTGDIGTSSAQKLKIEVWGANTTFTVNTDGNAYLLEDTNLARFGTSTVGGTLDLEAKGWLTTVGNISATDLTIKTNGNTGILTINSNVTGSNSATLSANGATGSIGGTGKVIGSSVDLESLSGGDITLKTAAGDLSANTGGNVTITEDNDVTLLASSAGTTLGTNTFNLSTVSGSITVDEAVTAGNITLTANNGGVTVNDDLNANTTVGTVNLSSTGTFDGITQNAGNISGSEVNLTTIGDFADIIQNNGSISGDEVNLSTTGTFADITQNNGSISGDEVNLITSGDHARITQNDGSISGDEVNLNTSGIFAEIIQNDGSISGDEVNLNTSGIFAEIIQNDGGISGDEVNLTTTGTFAEITQNDGSISGGEVNLNTSGTFAEITQNGGSISGDEVNLTTSGEFAGITQNDGSISGDEVNLTTSGESAGITQNDGSISGGEVNLATSGESAGITQNDGSISGGEVNLATSGSDAGITQNDGSISGGEVNLATSGANGHIIQNGGLIEGAEVTLLTQGGNAEITQADGAQILGDSISITSQQNQVTLGGEVGSNTTDSVSLSARTQLTIEDTGVVDGKTISSTATNGNITVAGTLGSEDTTETNTLLTQNNITVESTGSVFGDDITGTTNNGSITSSGTISGDDVVLSANGLNGHFTQEAGLIQGTSSILATTSGFNGKITQNDGSMVGGDITLRSTGLNGGIIQNGGSVDGDAVVLSTTGLNGQITQNDGSINGTTVNVSTTGLNGRITQNDGSISGSTVSVSTSGLNGQITQNDGSISGSTVSVSTTGLNGNITQQDGSISGITVNLTTAGALANITQNGGSIGGLINNLSTTGMAGNITQNGGSISGLTNNLSTSGALADITQNGGNISGVTNNLSTTGVDGDITQNGGSISGFINNLSTSGALANITQNGGSISGLANNLSTSGEAGNIVQNGGSISGAITNLTTTGDSADIIQNDGSITGIAVNLLATGLDGDIHQNGGLIQGTMVSLRTQGDNGEITQADGAQILGNTLNLTSEGNQITLAGQVGTPTSNTVTLQAETNITIEETGNVNGVTISSTTNTGNITVAGTLGNESTTETNTLLAGDSITVEDTGSVNGVAIDSTAETGDITVAGTLGNESTTETNTLLADQNISVLDTGSVNGVNILGTTTNGDINVSGLVGNAGSTLTTELVAGNDVAVNFLGLVTGEDIDVTAQGGRILLNGSIGTGGSTLTTDLTALGNIQGTGNVFGNRITLLSQAGSIGTSAAARLQTNATSLLNANSPLGSVWINQFGGGVTLFGTNTALSNFILTTVNPGDITVNGSVTANNVSLQTTGSHIFVNNSIQGFNQVLLQAAANGNITGPGLISGTNILLRGVNGSMNVNTNATNLSAITGGNVFINEANSVNLLASSAGGTFTLVTNRLFGGIYDPNTPGTITSLGETVASNIYFYSSGDILSGIRGVNIRSTGSSILSAQGVVGTRSNPFDVRVGGILSVAAFGRNGAFSGVLTGRARGNTLNILNRTPGIVLFNGFPVGGSAFEVASRTTIPALFTQFKNLTNPGFFRNMNTTASVIGTDDISQVEAIIVNQLTEPQPFDLRMLEEPRDPSDEDGPMDLRLIDFSTMNDSGLKLQPPEPQDSALPDPSSEEGASDLQSLSFRR